MGSTVSTVSDTVLSYVYPASEEIPLNDQIKKPHFLKRSIQFAYRSDLEYYFIPPNESWITTDKYITVGAIFRVKRILRHQDGKIQVFGIFDQERGEFDVSLFFLAIDPPIINKEFVYPFDDPPKTNMMPKTRFIY